MAIGREGGQLSVVERVDLAHAPDFRLGGLTVRPPLRQLVRDDGASEVVEPRVMQVLVALARANGLIVSRDDLVGACWEGRIVGDDAINRVISRLRKSAEGIGEGRFRIETITKVGYRLLGGDNTNAPRPAGEASAELAAVREEARKLRLDRRAMLAGSGAAVIGVGGWVFGRRWFAPKPDVPPPEVRALLDQARTASVQGTFEGGSQAQGLLRRVTEIRPDYADGWGLLALNYASASIGTSTDNIPTMAARAREAARRAFALQSDNPYARIAINALDADPHAWAADERLARSILARYPHNVPAIGLLVTTLLSVGRCREAVELRQGANDVALGPGPAYTKSVVFWTANRLDAADKAIDEAYAAFPTHFAVWFTRYYLYLYTNRAAQALAMGENREGWPTGIPEWNFEMINKVARAMISRRKADIDIAIDANLEAAHKGAGYAENTMQFASALGRLDVAFEVIDAYFFGRGFRIGDLRFAESQRFYMRRPFRRTAPLFYPSMAAARGDPRFAGVVAELGLADYWRRTGIQPDYLKG